MEWAAADRLMIDAAADAAALAWRPCIAVVIGEGHKACSDRQLRRKCSPRNRVCEEDRIERCRLIDRIRLGRPCCSCRRCAVVEGDLYRIEGIDKEHHRTSHPANADRRFSGPAILWI